MDMRSVQHQALVNEWKERILTQRNSGQNVHQWCEQIGVKEATYYYWLKVIRNEELITTNLPAASARAASFVELPGISTAVHPENCDHDICAVVHLSALRLEIHNGACVDTLGSILSLLRSLC